RSGNAFVSHDGVLELHTDEDEKREAVYIDRSGKRAFTNVFDSCGEFSEGLAAVEFEGKWVFINSEGKIILRTVFGSEVIVSSFSNGLAAINFNGKAKYIDRTGEVELETDFDWAENFTDGIARVKKID